MPRHNHYLPRRTSVALATMLLWVFTDRALEKKTGRTAQTIRNWREGKPAGERERGWMVATLKKRSLEMVRHPSDTVDHFVGTVVRNKLRSMRGVDIPKGRYSHAQIGAAIIAFLDDCGGQCAAAEVVHHFGNDAISKSTIYNACRKLKDQVGKEEGVWYLKDRFGDKRPQE